MDAHPSSRDRLIALLRRGERTVEELAQELGLTDNAVRGHLLTLGRDGVVERVGLRRRAGAGKPATLYRVRAEAEPSFSSAYAPALAAVVAEIAEELPPRQARALLRAAGRRIAGTRAPASGSVAHRARAAANLLASLGAQVDVEVGRSGVRLRGSSCPLSAAVAGSPDTCQLVGALVAEVSGARVRECCEHGERPRCCFELVE